MTMVLEQPHQAEDDTEHRNGNSTAIATIDWRGAKLVINRDSGPFSYLLDTGKFTQMYRLAEMFAASQLVPQIFRGKPNDCFIAIQMAMRLGVDPFMFLQNTYPGPGGKPGMEGKLAIALINSSGLFKGQIRYELTGKGDDLGCVAWAIDKATGERIDGPRVTIGVAKAEGWYARNPKWKNVPDLMLQYRAGAWFGRLMCPERLMGMQTREEIEDISPMEPVEQRNRGAAALADRINHALPDTQLSDAEAEAIIQRKAEQAHADEPQPAEQIEQTIEPVTADDAPRFPDKLPDHARADMGWLDDLIRERKPEEISMHEARKRFGKLHAPHSWAKVPLDEQDALYARLRDEPGLLDS